MVCEEVSSKIILNMRKNKYQPRRVLLYGRLEFGLSIMPPVFEFQVLFLVTV